MYCYHCGKQINEEKIEMKKSSFGVAKDLKSTDNVSVSYVCPRCGHLIHKNHTDEDNKSLARAAHAQVQRANNDYASGMGKFVVGLILFAIAVIFFFLSKKATNQNAIATDCAEFYVFVVLGVISVILLAWGLSLSIHGTVTKKRYEELLKDLNNTTFVQ